MSTVWDRIEQARERWNVLRHPFYERWSAGELSREELARYSGQYRHAVGTIAEMSEAAAAAAPERAELRGHAAEERAHVALWDGFVAAVGGSAEAAAAPETADCVAEWTSGKDLLEVAARLYAIESGQPEIARVKRQGLVEHYGVAEGPGTEYFRVHETRDGDHAAEGRALIADRADDGEEDRLVEAAEATFRANWRLLDGV